MGSNEPNFGLKTLQQGDSLSEDGYAFTDKNPRVIGQQLARIGTHRHDGTEVVSADAPDQPVATVSGSVDGAFPGAMDVFYRVSKTVDGVESPGSTVTPVTTPDALGVPDNPTLAVATTGGSLMAGIYMYAITAWRDHLILESAPSDGISANLVIAAGDAQVVTLTPPTLPVGADGYNIYRRIPGSATWNFLASVTGSGAYVDDGLVAADVERQIPVEDFSSLNAIEVDLTGLPALAAGETYRVYRSYEDDYWGDSLIAEILHTDPLTFIDGGGATEFGSPLETSVVVNNPPPVDLYTETTGTLPPHRTTNRYYYNSSGARSANRHNDWAELMADLALVSEPGKLIHIEQDEEVPTAGMPVGGWHLHGAAFAADVPAILTPHTVTFPTGTKLDPAGVTGGALVMGGVRLYSTAAADPIVEFAGSTIVTISLGGMMAKAAPFMRFDSPAGMYVVSIVDGANLAKPSDAGIMDGDYEAIDFVDGSFALINVDSSGGIFDDTVRGAMTAGLRIDVERGDDPMTGMTQTNLPGGVWGDVSFMAAAWAVRLDNLVAGDWAEGVPAAVAGAITTLGARTHLTAWLTAQDYVAGVPDGTAHSIQTKRIGGRIHLRPVDAAATPIAHVVIVAAPRDEVQQLAIDATGGTVTVTYDGQTTGPVNFDASGATWTTEMEALSNIAPGDVVVTGGPGDAGATTPYEFAFGGTLAATNVPEITASAASLTGGASTATPSTTIDGWPGGGPRIIGYVATTHAPQSTRTAVVNAEFAGAATPVRVTVYGSGAVEFADLTGTLTDADLVDLYLEGWSYGRLDTD